SYDSRLPMSVVRMVHHGGAEDAEGRSFLNLRKFLRPQNSGFHYATSGLQTDRCAERTLQRSSCPSCLRGEGLFSFGCTLAARGPSWLSSRRLEEMKKRIQWQ